jgi:hypothetical protein
VSLAVASTGLAKASALLSGRVGLSATGAAKAVARAGIVARVSLIAATAAHAAGRAAAVGSATVRSTKARASGNLFARIYLAAC